MKIQIKYKKRPGEHDMIFNVNKFKFPIKTEYNCAAMHIRCLLNATHNTIVRDNLWPIYSLWHMWQINLDRNKSVHLSVALAHWLNRSPPIHLIDYVNSGGRIINYVALMVGRHHRKHTVHRISHRNEITMKLWCVVWQHWLCAIGNNGEMGGRASGGLRGRLVHMAIQ